MQRDKNGRTNRLGSFPIFSVVFSTTMALLVIGAFSVLLIHAHRLTEKVQENVTIQVYLNKKVKESAIIRLDQAFRNEPFVLRKDDIPQVVFISKQEAAEMLIQETGENFIEVLEDNPLRDSFVLYITPLYQSNEQLRTIKEKISKMADVFEVHYVENLVTTINNNVKYIGALLGFFALLLLIAVVVLINNTIKLALYSQRFLIRSMNLVGASPSFIRNPFLLRAGLIGLLAGMVADIGLLVGLQYANLQIEPLVHLQRPIPIFLLMGSLPILGIAVTSLSAYWAINKYIYASLEDLH
jgi:cell division transport system permease protein